MVSDKDEVKVSEDHRDKVPVRLSIYEWHILLNEMEHSLRFVNRDAHNLNALYIKITAQLNNGEAIPVKEC